MHQFSDAVLSPPRPIYVSSERYLENLSEL